MRFRNDNQRKAVFSNLNKFSLGSDKPQDILGALGDKLAVGVVQTYPEHRTDGVVGLFPEKKPQEPPLGKIVECLVVDAFPDGKPIDSYGEAFAGGVAKEWVDAADGKLDGKLDGKKLP